MIKNSSFINNSSEFVNRRTSRHSSFSDQNLNNFGLETDRVVNRTALP
jgi:hypothetical protein